MNEKTLKEKLECKNLVISKLNNYIYNIRGKVNFREVSLLYQRTLIFPHLCLWYQGKEQKSEEIFCSFTICLKVGNCF